LMPVILVNHHILEQNHETALGGADGEKQVDHPEDCPVMPQHKNPPAARLFQQQSQAAHLLRAVRVEIGLHREQVKSKSVSCGRSSIVACSMTVVSMNSPWLIAQS